MASKTSYQKSNLDAMIEADKKVQNALNENSHGGAFIGMRGNFT